MKTPNIIGQSRSIRELWQFIYKVAKTDSNILILGETGVGKDLAAKAIHAVGNRTEGPFIKVNGASLNETLVESELFGHRKGAFTGALFDKPGLIEAACAGTLFMDEIGDISPNLQGKLLSVIEDKETRRVGDTRSQRIDTRFIFATNKDLNDLLSKGHFRSDLYYRINILSFTISPLRERRVDIPLLSSYFLQRENENAGINKHITKDAIDGLLTFSYPGNIRQLENIIKRAYLASPGTEIGPGDIRFSDVPMMSRKKRVRITKKEIELSILKNDGNITKTAHELGISRTWLYKVIK